jgi:hypothetical protein
MHFFGTEVLEEAMSSVHFLFFLQTFIFGVGRGRRCSRVALLQRCFDFISILVFASLGGFRTSRSRISLDWSFLGKMRARNQETGGPTKRIRRTILANNAQYKEMNNKSQHF